MEQEQRIQPGTGGAGSNQEQMPGTGFSGNVEAGQAGGLEAAAESCDCEHETGAATVGGQSCMDGGPAGFSEATMGQPEARVQYQQPPQVQPQYQAQPQYQPQNQPYQQPPRMPPQYQPQQVPSVHFAPPFPPHQVQQGSYFPPYAQVGHPGMMPFQGPDIHPPMNPAESGRGFGHMGADAKHVEHDENRFGQMADMVSRFVQGEATTGDMVKDIFSLNFRNDQFWKGALAGALVALVLNSDMVKQSVGKVFGGASAKTVQPPETRDSPTEKSETETKTKKRQ